MPPWARPTASLPLAPPRQRRRRIAAATLAAVLLLGATGCAGEGGSNAGPSWGLPLWPSRSFGPPSDSRPPWLSPTPLAPVPRIRVPEGTFQA